MPTFLVKTWGKKVLKSAVAAGVAYLTGPIVAPIFQALGITVNAAQAQAGIWVALTAAGNWLKHGTKVPGWLKSLL